MNEILHKKVSPPFEGGVIGTINYLIYTVFYFPTGVVDSLILLTFIGMKTKTSLTGKALNSSDHHLGTSPHLLRLRYGIFKIKKT